MSVRERTLAHAAVTAMSVSFSGELSYELHIPNEQLLLVWRLINDAGKQFNLSKFGLYATESMRLEKGYRHWKADLIYERNPLELRLDRFVDLGKDSFVGKAALLEEVDRGPVKLFVNLIVDCDVAAAHVGAPVRHKDKLVGSVTSGGYGHRVQQNIAYALIDPDACAIGTELSVEVLGTEYKATVTVECLYDEEYAHVRS